MLEAPVLLPISGRGMQSVGNRQHTLLSGDRKLITACTHNKLNRSHFSTEAQDAAEIACIAADLHNQTN